MKVRDSWVLVPILLVAVAGCAPSGEPAGEELATEAPAEIDASAFEALVVDWDAALNDMDADAVLALYGDDPVAMAPFAPAREGDDAIRGWLDELFGQGAVNVKNETSEVHGAGEWVFARGTFTLSVTPEEGESTSDTGKWVAISRVQADGSMKIVRNIWNSDLPPAGMPGPPGTTPPEMAELPPLESPPCLAEVSASDQAFTDAFVGGDAAMVAALHAEGGMRLPPGMTAVVGRPAVATYAQTYIARFEPRDLQVTQQGYQSAGDWGFTWGLYQAVYEARDGSDAFEGGGKYVAVSRRGDDGCWRYEWVIWNSDSPPPGT